MKDASPTTPGKQLIQSRAVNPDQGREGVAHGAEAAFGHPPRFGGSRRRNGVAYIRCWPTSV